MNVLIVEDETLAAERLITLLKKACGSFTLQGTFESIEETVAFFEAGQTTDLLFLDIELTDGKSFEVFNRVDVNVPIIFTTAYDQYALQAFKHFSIDYLLKPIRLEELEKAIAKWRRIHEGSERLVNQLGQLKEWFRSENQKPKERLVVKSGNRLQYKSAEEVAYFFADGKEVYMVTLGENKKYLIDYTLEELEKQLDKDMFFRISRKAIVHAKAIAEVKGLISTRLEVKLKLPSSQELTISRDRSSAFKAWLDR